MMKKILLSLCCLSFSLLAQTNPLNDVLQQIEQLENNSDPKCYATASRLEDFMFGTPLSDQARFDKHQLQQQWLQNHWQLASELAKTAALTVVDAPQVKQALKQSFDFSQNSFLFLKALHVIPL